jgi:hypothetical protein
MHLFSMVVYDSLKENLWYFDNYRIHDMYTLQVDDVPTSLR